MNLQTLLGDVPIQQFVADFYDRLPYSAAGLAAPLCELGTWKSLTAILGQDNADVLVCRRNEQFAGPLPRTANDAMRLVDDGYTLLVRHAERHDPRLAEVAAAFSRDFAAPVNIHMYCTPGGQYGFGWHYDAEEVFIVQTTGRKQYSLRKNTVNPWPIEETLPADMQYEREMMPLCREEGIGVIPWSPLARGFLVGNRRPRDFGDTVRAKTDCVMLEMLRNVLDIMQRNKNIKGRLAQFIDGQRRVSLPPRTGVSPAPADLASCHHPSLNGSRNT
jgi:hypothetical protein